MSRDSPFKAKCKKVQSENFSTYAFHFIVKSQMKKSSCLAVSIIDRFDGAAERSGRSHSEPQTGGDLRKNRLQTNNLTQLL